MIGDLIDDPFGDNLDDNGFLFRPHDIKTSGMTGDSHCRLCMDFHPVDTCTAPMCALTSDNGTEWIVALAEYDSKLDRVEGTVKHVLRFYDRRQAGKPGFNALLGQFVSEYFTDTLIDGTTPVYGLNLNGGEPSWQIDAAGMGAIVDWATSTEYWQERGA